MSNKHVNYTLSKDELTTVLFALELFPNIDMAKATDPIQEKVNAYHCKTAIEKLANKKADFHSNELRVMYAALFYVKSVAIGDIIETNSLRKICSPFGSSAKKLVNFFEESYPDLFGNEN